MKYLITHANQVREYYATKADAARVRRYQEHQASIPMLPLGYFSTLVERARKHPLRCHARTGEDLKRSFPLVCLRRSFVALKSQDLSLLGLSETRTGP